MALMVINAWPECSSLNNSGQLAFIARELESDGTVNAPKTLLFAVVSAHELLRHKTSLPFLDLITCVLDQL
jgi:hypothetical protein